MLTDLAHPAAGEASLIRGRSQQVRWIVVSLAILALCAVAGLLIGSRGLSPATVLDVVGGGGSGEARTILLDLRLPRTLIAALAGAALAVSGAVMQGHTRNPLADPGLLGVGAGAAVAVVLAISFLGITDPSEYLWFAFSGAALTASLVTAFGLLGSRRRNASAATLVLAGAAVTALLSSVTGLVLLLDSATLDEFRFWTVGSLSGGRDLDLVVPVLPFILIGLALAMSHASTLDALALGDDLARALGRRLAATRVTGLAIVTLLVGSAVAISGSIGFVGLIVPHLVRRLTGPAHRWLLPQCAVVGAALVIAADIVGRVVVTPAELPVGVVLGVIGAPAFLLIVVRLREARA